MSIQALLQSDFDASSTPRPLDGAAFSGLKRLLFVRLLLKAVVLGGTLVLDELVAASVGNAHVNYQCNNYW